MIGVERALCRSVPRALNSDKRNLLPRSVLLAWIVDGEDTIGLSISDYALIGSTFQSTFFVDADTPILHTPADWAVILAAHADINLLNVMGTEAKGWAVYRSDTSREILNKALRYFGLSQIYDPFGPTWSEPETWDDNKIWTES